MRKVLFLGLVLVSCGLYASEEIDIKKRLVFDKVLNPWGGTDPLKTLKAVEKNYHTDNGKKNSDFHTKISNGLDTKNMSSKDLVEIVFGLNCQICILKDIIQVHELQIRELQSRTEFHVNNLKTEVQKLKDEIQPGQ